MNSFTEISNTSGGKQIFKFLILTEIYRSVTKGSCVAVAQVLVCKKSLLMSSIFSMVCLDLWCDRPGCSLSKNTLPAWDD